ncbi:MAG: IPT/TIG domain-containing protein [Planctomycetota bacterium]|jgi:hypothetical protein
MKTLRPFLIPCLLLLATACGGGSSPTGDGGLPGDDESSGGGSASALALLSVADQEGATSGLSVGGGTPQGAVVTWIGQTVRIDGEGFSEDMRVFFGMNNALARAESSLLTTDAADLPAGPFVYTDPDSAVETILEVEATFTFVSENVIDVQVPAGLACSQDFSPAGGPVLRLTDEDGSSEPATDILFIVGPQAFALDRTRGSESGGYPVAIFGERFSPNTQVAIRFTDPTTGTTRVLGDGETSNGALNADDDLAEQIVDSRTIVVPSWPTPGVALAGDLTVDVLVYENIESIAAEDPSLGRACQSLEPEGDVELNATGSRNFELLASFVYASVVGAAPPLVDSVSPVDGSVLGGELVVVRGGNFDGDTIDLGGANPGVRIEMPAGSGTFVTPAAASLIDGNTLLLAMPAASANTSANASLFVRNRYTIDTHGDDADSYIRFANRYRYRALPPVKAPALSAVVGEPNDAGSQRIVLLGDRFDGDTALSGIEIVVGGETYAAERVVRHDDRVLEVFLPRLAEPLATDTAATLRLTNAEGSAEFADAFIFRATPDAGAAPSIATLAPAGGAVGGGNRILIEGANFDTDSGVRFGSAAASDVRFVSPSLLIATVPPASEAGSVEVVVTDGADSSASVSYEYGAPSTGPQIATIDEDTGHDAGGYGLVLRGTGFTPTTTVEFGGGSNNMAADIVFVNATCLRVVAPAALDAQEGSAVPLRAYDALAGAGPDGASFQYLVELAAMIDSVATTAGGNDLYLHGGDRVLAEGSGFDANTSFEVTQDTTTSAGTAAIAIGPRLAVFTAPAAPVEAAEATLVAKGAATESPAADVAYVPIPAPEICAVRTLASDEPSAREGERIVIFGDFFYDSAGTPLKVSLTGSEAGTSEEKTVEFTGSDLQRLGDSILAVRIPVGVFEAGDLGIEVETASGSTSFIENGSPIFTVEGPQAPVVDSVTPNIVFSSGGAFAVFSGRHFTSTTRISLRTTLGGDFVPVRGLRIVSETVATGYFPPLPGGMPPAGIPGIVRAEETDAARMARIDGDPFTESKAENALFVVIDESTPALLAIVPDHGSINGGEQVLLFGDGFLGADGQPNVGSIVFRHPDIGEVEYERIPATDAPLLGNAGGVNNGKFMVVNDSTILLISAARPPILLGDELPVDVEVRGVAGTSVLMGAFTYVNTPAVRTPVLAGITPNEVRRNGGSTHLVSGGFLTEVDRLILSTPGTELRVTIPREDFREVNDFFVVFEMPDLRGAFAVLDKLTIRAEKDVAGNPERLISNALTEALTVTFAGPPAIEIESGVQPSSGSSFGGTIATLKGSLFTTNTQILFGTRRVAVVVVEDENTLRFVVPALPIDAPGDGLDLLNVHEEGRDKTIDVAVFTQGGWAVLEDAFTLDTEAPLVESISPNRAIEGSTTRITMKGERFLPNIEIVPLLDGQEGETAGAVSNVTFVSFEEIRFDYTAPTPEANTLGPLEIVFRVSTNHGTALSPPFFVELSPFVDSVRRVGDDGDVTVPTTGIEGGKRIIFEAIGGNFAADAALTVINRQGDRLELTEVESLNGGGQFVLLSDTEIRFTPPFAFGNDTPTLLEGNPNVGPVAIELLNANGLDASFSDAFIYVPAVLDFDNFAFRIPTGVANDAVPHELTIGDINGDGLPDAAMMVRAATPDISKPEVYVFIADSFGKEDVNGDGITPDFAGTFTKYVINDTTVRTEAGFLGRGGTVLLGNFDDDDHLELAVPTRVASNTNAVRVLIADYDEAGDKFVVKKLLTADGPKSDAVGGIAVGNFDGGDSHDDIALVVEDIAKTKRRLTVYKSTGSLSFDQFSVALPTDCCGGRVGYLAAGNFDGKGADELIWAHTDWSTGKRAKDWPVVIASINGASESVKLEPLTNFTGGEIHDIEIFDHDGDGKESAALIVQNDATLDGKLKPGGVAILLDPMSLKVSAYIETAFNDNGRALGAGDVDGDGVVDMVAGNTLGEFFLLIGAKDGTFVDGANSWFLPSIPESFPTRIENIGIADLNGDGLGEIWVGDIGSAPTSLQIFLNISR